MEGSGTGTLTWSKLIDIKDFPDLGGEPEMLDVTTLSDKTKKFIPGIQSNEALTFTTNYTLSDYQQILEKANQELDYAIWFGGTETLGVVTPTGDDGKFKFKGILNVYVNGTDVNNPINMTITIAPTTSIELDN